MIGGRRLSALDQPGTNPSTGRERGRWDDPTMVVTLDAKRRLTVRAALAPAEPGAYFDAHFDAEEDAIVFRRLGGRELAAGVEEASYDEAFLRDE